MARTLLYCSDTYLAGPRGALVVAGHREFNTAEEAVRRAERDAVKGAAVGPRLLNRGRPRVRGLRRPCVLARFGRTPET